MQDTSLVFPETSIFSSQLKPQYPGSKKSKGGKSNQTSWSCQWRIRSSHAGLVWSGLLHGNLSQDRCQPEKIICQRVITSRTKMSPEITHFGKKCQERHFDLKQSTSQKSFVWNRFLSRDFYECHLRGDFTRHVPEVR